MLLNPGWLVQQAASRTAAVLLLLVALSSVSGCSHCHSLMTKHRKPQLVALPPETVTVTGVVRNSGIYNLPDVGGYTLQQAIAVAGGMVPDWTNGNAIAATALVSNNWSITAVTLRRQDVTYVIPAFLVESSEYGRIRLKDRDVVCVLSLREAGYEVTVADNNTATTTPAKLYEGTNSNETLVSFQGVTLLNGREIDVNDLKNVLGTTLDVNGKLLFQTSQDTADKIFDFNSANPAAFVRVIRRASSDGLPRVYIFPIVQTSQLNNADTVLGGYRPLGGDTIVYLPAGTDPLVVVSDLSEKRLRRGLEAARRQARY